MKKSLSNKVQDDPGNTLVLIMIGAAFLAAAGSYMHTAQAGDNTRPSAERTRAVAEERTYGQAQERTHAQAQERTHAGQAEERNRVSDTTGVATTTSRQSAGPAEDRQYSGATSRHGDR